MLNLINDILKIFEQNNLFDEGVELIGSWCFQLYQEHLGARSFPLRTQDIDFLIPNPHRGKPRPEFLAQLEELGFNTGFKHDGSLFLWNAELKIEFITPDKGRGADKAINVKQLGLRAIPLRFVNMLLDDPIKIVEGGIAVKIPNPVNFCLHKLIIVSRRRNIEKGMKDLEQAICTSGIVNADELRRQFESLPRKWKQAILRVLERAKEQLPLYQQEIKKLQFTLRNQQNITL